MDGTLLHLPVWTLLLAVFTLQAQNGSSLNGVGYNPAPILISPGQIVQLQISGLQYLSNTGTFFQKNALGTPLPTSLAGLSARIGQNQQSLPPFTGLSFFSLPLIAVQQFST